MKKKKFKIPGREHWAAVGLARICSKQYVLVDAQFNDIKNAQIDQFLRRQLQIGKGEPLVRLLYVCDNVLLLYVIQIELLFIQFIYVRSAFCPHPNEQLGDLAHVSLLQSRACL